MKIWRDAGVVGIVVVILVAIATAIVTKVLEHYSTQEVAFASLVVIGSILGVGAVVSIILLRRFEAKTDGIIEALAAMATRIKADWIITSNQLRERERKTKHKHIWIITKSLEEEINPDQFGSVVGRNLKRNVKYTYFVPASSVMRLRIAHMKSMHGNTPNLQFKLVDNKLFELVAAQDVAIFGPVGLNVAGSREGYMNLPITAGGYDYFIVLSSEHSERLVAILNEEAVDFDAIEAA